MRRRFRPSKGRHVNRCFRSRWNAALGTWVAAPETSRRHGGAGRSVLPLAALALALPALAQTTINPGDTLYVTNPGAQVTGDLIINGGTLRAGAQALQDERGQWQVTKTLMSRSARILMEGWVRVPGEVLGT